MGGSRRAALRRTPPQCSARTVGRVPLSLVTSGVEQRSSVAAPRRRQCDDPPCDPRHTMLRPLPLASDQFNLAAKRHRLSIYPADVLRTSCASRLATAASLNLRLSPNLQSESRIECGHPELSGVFSPAAVEEVPREQGTSVELVPCFTQIISSLLRSFRGSSCRPPRQPFQRRCRRPARPHASKSPGVYRTVEHCGNASVCVRSRGWNMSIQSN